MKPQRRLDDASDPIRSQILGLEGPPAFMRRARHVQETLDTILKRCHRQRDEWLTMVRLRLATVAALTGDWQRLRRWLADDEQVEVLRQLHDDLRSQLRLPVPVTGSSGRLRSALAELIESLERFNRRWQEFVSKVDLTLANEAREKYNRFYLLEKECAVGRAGLTRQDFVQLPPLRHEDVIQHYPPLPVPRVAAR
jgi:hypothetical protein